MSSYVLSLFKGLLKKKTTIPTNEEKVKQLGAKALGLFDHMKKAHDDLSEINKELEAIVEDEQALLKQEDEAHQRKVSMRLRNIGNAHQEIGMNLKVQNKLKDFIER